MVSTKFQVLIAPLARACSSTLRATSYSRCVGARTACCCEVEKRVAKETRHSASEVGMSKIVAVLHQGSPKYPEIVRMYPVCAYVASLPQTVCCVLGLHDIAQQLALFY